MSDVLSMVWPVNWWLVTIAVLVLAYAALVLVSLGYADGRWVPRSGWKAALMAVGSLLWLPVMIAWLCYQLMRVAHAVARFFFMLGDSEAELYHQRQRVKDLPF